MGAVYESPGYWRSLPITLSALKHVSLGVKPCGRTRALRTHETLIPTALGQVFNVGLECEEASTELLHILRIIRSTLAHIVSQQDRPESTVEAFDSLYTES